MHRFEYRLPRQSAGFGVDFVVGEEILRGLCKDVSEAGIRAEFDGPALVGSSGLLTLRHPTRCFKLRAEVAYVEEDQSGLSFLFESPQERALTIQFVASIAKHPSAAHGLRLSRR